MCHGDISVFVSIQNLDAIKPSNRTLEGVWTLRESTLQPGLRVYKAHVTVLLVRGVWQQSRHSAVGTCFLSATRLALSGRIGVDTPRV